VEEQKRHTSMAEIDALRCSLTCAECGSGILVNTQRMTKIEAWLAEQGEFELPVQICKQSDDSIKSTYQSNKECRKCTHAAALSIDFQTGLMMTATVESDAMEPASVEPTTMESVTVEPITMESAEAFAAE
jgi:hypothetical protein